MTIFDGDIVTLYDLIAPPRLLFTLSGPYIRHVNLDGRRALNLYTGGSPRAIDFDYRQVDV